MVNLTQPTVLCFGSKLPDDKTMRNYALEIDAHLQSYKEVGLEKSMCNVLLNRQGRFCGIRKGNVLFNNALNIVY